MNHKSLLEEIIKKLDITPTMYKNATEKYEALAKYLESQGVNCNIYPQGSFALGAVVRPFKEGKDTDYDLDMVCELTASKERTTPRQVKWSVGTPLAESELYSSKELTEYDRCWTIHYAKVDGDEGFSMDIVPCVHEANIIIDNVIKTGVDVFYANEAIAITNKEITGVYNWGQSNPRGYKQWFDRINTPFLAFSHEANRRSLYLENRSIYASIEEVPSALERSALQRVIQILKRHRDIYYSRARHKKPISAIITTLAAKIAQNAPVSSSVFDLMQFIANEMYQYASLLHEEQNVFEQRNQTRTYIRKIGNTWSIKNPINPNDNYTESWTKEDAEYFFKWLLEVKSDFLDRVDESDQDYITGLECGFGKQPVESMGLGKKIHIPPIAVSQTKPWGEV